MPEQQIPQTRDPSIPRLNKKDYDALVCKASRGALLCEFMDQGMVMRISDEQLYNYLGELSDIATSIRDMLINAMPESRKAGD